MGYNVNGHLDVLPFAAVSRLCGVAVALGLPSRNDELGALALGEDPDVPRLREAIVEVIARSNEPVVADVLRKRQWTRGDLLASCAALMEAIDEPASEQG